MLAMSSGNGSFGFGSILGLALKLAGASLRLTSIFQFIKTGIMRMLLVLVVDDLYVANYQTIVVL